MDGEPTDCKPTKLGDVERGFEEIVDWMHKLEIPFSARAVVKGRGVCLGLTVAGMKPCLGWYNKVAPELVLLLNTWIRKGYRQLG